MKKALYFIAAITMVASSAMASKARVAALGGWPVIADPQTIFNNPADMHYVGDYVTFEMGEVPNSALAASDNKELGAVTPNAEGGFINTIGDSKFGFYLGRMSADTNSFRAAAAAQGPFLATNNPMEVFYGSKAGDVNWGIGFGYSSSEEKGAAGSADDQKQNAMGMRMGVKTDEWAVFANVGLGADAKNGSTAEVKGKSQVSVGGSYNINTMKFYGRYDNAAAKAIKADGTDLFDDAITLTAVGFLNTWRVDGNMAFYGLSYRMWSDINKVSGFDIKRTKSFLPLCMGTEILATSWLKLRGSISQNILVSSDKVVDPTGTYTAKEGTLAHNTTTSAGAGFIWGKNVLDVVMVLGTNGNLDASAGSFGTNASYTYTF